MKPYLYLIAAGFLMQSCATSHITTEVKDTPSKPLTKILVLTTETNHDYYRLDSATYNNKIRGNFNNMDNAIFRQQLEKSMQRSMGSYATTIVPASNVYTTNSDIGFSDFIEKTTQLGVDGILLINLDNYWNTNSTRVVNTYNNQIETKTEESPNAAYNCYLFNATGDKILWLAHVEVNGQAIAGYDVLNNRLTAKLKKDLTKARFIEDTE
ncbi:hypothetical protein [Limnovirga soli]|jgi:hypothetical protein|uniref:Lipoprotein n=1 Tax=Limnovirga soli TaxID=2656915 RepID=A0A8J8FLX1_9BACT|nr:hypothetical protein [Limnovirga soli]NNV57264.1 hypothetical protein [Limnovirga soli]